MDTSIVLSMFMLSFIFLIVCDLFEQAFYRLFIYIYILSFIQLSRGEWFWDHIICYIPTTFVPALSKDLDF